MLSPHINTCEKTGPFDAVFLSNLDACQWKDYSCKLLLIVVKIDASEVYSLPVFYYNSSLIYETVQGRDYLVLFTEFLFLK